MAKNILVLGATGMLGRPVVRALLDQDHRVTILVRDPARAESLFGDAVEIKAGSAGSRADLQAVLRGCDAVHINLPQEVELSAAQYLLELAHDNLERITYVSATTAFEQNRWFPLVNSKLQVEEALRQSGIPQVVFCPTWVMETLHNFYHGDRGMILIGRNPPPLHFFCAADFGRIVAATYAGERAVGKRLFIHGPQAITLPVALERYFSVRYPRARLTRLTLWQARLIARLTRRRALAGVVELLDYFDQVGELGDPAETNRLFGAPTTTLDEWLAAQHP